MAVIKANSLIKSVHDSFTLGLDIDITSWDLFKTPSILDPSTEFKRCAYSGCSHELIYLAGKNNGDYNFMLKDGSYLQFWWDEMGKRRFAYYPCPYAVDDVGALAEEEDISNYSLLFSKPIVRYDCDPKAHKPNTHPIGHLHIGMDEDSRLMCAKVMTPLLFSMFIFRKFYYSNWELIIEEVDKNLFDINAATPNFEVYKESEFGLFHLT